MAHAPEGKVKAEGRATCRRLGIFSFAVNQTGMSVAGLPDDCLCVNGMFVFIEYKAHMRWDKNHKTALATLPRLNQVKAMQDCREAGGITLVVDDENILHLAHTLVSIQEWTGHHSVEYIARVRLPRECPECNWDWTVAEMLAYGRGEIDKDKKPL